MPGYCDSSLDGIKLGAALEFRTRIGAGFRFDNGRATTLAVDHRPHADLSDRNPGMEHLSVRYLILFDRR